MDNARYIGRVGALAVALGVGAAVASSPGIAWAGPDTESTAPADNGADTADTTAAAGTEARADSNSSKKTGSTTYSDDGDPVGDSPTQHSAEVAPGVVVSHSGGANSSSDPTAKPAPKHRKSVSTAGTSQSTQPRSAPQSAVGAKTSAATAAPVTGSSTPAAAPSAAPTAVASAAVVDSVGLADVSGPAASTEAQPTVVSSVVSSVLTVLAAPFGVTGDPTAPVESPAMWVLAAAARRQFGAADTAREASTVPAEQTLTSQAASATATENLAPVIDNDDYDATTADPVTGAIVLENLAHDPEGKKLTYAVITPPAQGKLVFNKITGLYAYTPTASQRVLAGLTAGPQTVSFDITVTDGKTKLPAHITVEVAPTTIADVSEVATGDGSLGVAVTNTRAYVTNSNTNTVTVIDTIHGTKITDIEVGDFPMGVAVSPDGKKVYVSGQENNTIAVIDATSNTVTSTIQLGDRSPQLMAISKDGRTLFVTTTVYDPTDDTVVLSSGVTKISTTSGKITGTVTNVGLVPYQITVSPDGKKVYVIAEVESDTGDYQTGVFVFSSTSTSAKQILGVGDRVESMDVSPDNTRLYVGDYNSGVISIIDTKTNKIIGSITADPETIDDVAVNSDGTLLMVENFDTHAIDVYDTSTKVLLHSVPTNATTDLSFPETVLSPDGQQLYYTSDGALQIISLVPANQFPVKNGPTVGDPNATTGVVTGNVEVTDPDGDHLSYTPTTPGKGKVVINPDGSFTYTPTAAARHAASAVGAPASALTDTFTVTISDGRRGIVTQDITVDIEPANINPVIKTSAGTPSSSTGIVKGSVTATDKDKDPITVTGTQDTTKGTVVFTGTKYVYTPTAAARHAAATGAPGTTTDTFTVNVDDGHGGLTPVSVTVKIRPANNDPEATASSLGSPDAGTGAVIGTVTATDPDPGDDFTVTGPVATKKGTLTYANHTFTYTPTAAARAAASAPGASTSTKTDKFTITVNDGHGGTDTLSVSLTIAATDNDAPTGGTFTAGSPAAADGKVTGTVHATDPNTDPLTYSGNQTTDQGTVTVLSNGNYTYTPTSAARHAASANGAGAALTTDTFNLTASDGRGGTLSIPVTVTIGPKNAAPTGNFTAGTPDADSGLVSGTVTSADADGDTRTYSAPTTSTKGGTVTINATTGAYTYTPTAAARTDAAAAGASAADKQDTFTVTINDGHTPNGTGTVNVTVTVAPATSGNQPPTATPTVQIPNANGVVTGAVNGTDSDGPAPTYSVVTQPAFADQFSLDETTGTFTYRPTTAARSAASTGGATTDTFSVRVQDSGGASTTVPITVDIAPSTAVPSVAGFPAGPIVVGTNGTAYQLLAKYSGNDVIANVQVFTSSGSSITVTLPGLPVSALVRQGNDVLLTTATVDDTGTQIASTQVSRISSTGAITSVAVDGAPAGNLVVAADGTAYQAITTTAVTGVIVNGQPLTFHTFVVLRITPTGTVSTQTLGTVPTGTVYGQPIGDLATGPDGTAYQAFSGLTVFSDNNHYTTGSGIMVIPSVGTAHLSDMVDGYPEAGAVAGQSGTAYMTMRTTDHASGDETTTVLTVSGPVTRTQVMVGTPEGGVVQGANGVAYQTTTTFSTADGSTTTYITKIGGATSAPIAGRPESALQVASDGSAFQIVGNGGFKMVAIGTAGTVSVVPLVAATTDFVVGSDNKAYLLNASRDQISVITSGGSLSAIPLGGTSRGDITPAPDGTLYQAVQGANGFFIKNLTTGETSDPTPLFGSNFTGDVLSLGPDGSAVFIVGATDSGAPITNILVVAPDGTTVVHQWTPGAPSPDGAVAFAPDGTAYLLTAASGSDGGTVTTLLAITSGGVTQVLQTSAFPTQPVTIGSGTVYLSLTTFTAENEYLTQEFATATIPNPAPPSLSSVTQTGPDRTTGVVTGTVVATPRDANPGATIQYSGTTTGPLGTVVVNPDGTYTFTPNAQARALAQQSGKVLNAVFFVTATDGDGHSLAVPVSAQLMPTNPPPASSEPAPLRFLDMIALPGGLNPGGLYSPQSLFDVHAVQWCATGGCWPGDKHVEGKWLYDVENWKRTGSVGLMEDASGQLVSPDIYVVAVASLPGEDYNGFVIGYRKMQLGDDITVKQDMYSDTTGFITYWPMAFMPGTFPTNLFKTRIDGVVGGYIFNNEIPDALYQAMQRDGYEQAMTEYLDQHTKEKNAVNTAAKWTKILGPLIVTPTTGLLGVALKGVTLVGGVLKVFSGKDEVDSTYDSQQNPMFLVESPDLTTTPGVGIPD